ncbi:hypothetical protein BaRGS_00030598 [Batillaria attramentaria]|uniref:MAM domain-containing protein n=1 Tax=Batillaria attramentaria TaxID=370345 RepID=A0ABD0JTQ4_9CAEN
MSMTFVVFVRALEMDISNHWSGGFQGLVEYVVPAEINGWNMHIIFSEPVASLEVWNAVLHKVNDREYILTNQDWNAVLKAGEKLSINFIGHGNGDIHPHVCAYLEGVEQGVCSSPQATISPPSASTDQPGVVCYTLFPTTVSTACRSSPPTGVQKGPLYPRERSEAKTGEAAVQTPSTIGATLAPATHPPSTSTSHPTLAPILPGSTGRPGTAAPPHQTFAPTHPPPSTAGPTLVPTTAPPLGVTDTPAPPHHTIVPVNPTTSTAAIPTMAPTTASPGGTSADTPAPPHHTIVPIHPQSSTAIPTMAPTTASPAGGTSTGAPTLPPRTVAPTHPPPASTVIPTLAPPTPPPAGATDAPTLPPQTLAPTHPPPATTAIPTIAPTTASPISPWQDTCNFDQPGFCDWTTTPDAFEWTLNKGPTSTANTGPESDHTLGTDAGYYAYIETSDPGPGDNAGLESTHLTPNYAYCLDFWYHMYGTSIGSLNIRLKEKGSVGAPIWTKTGPSEQMWHHAQIDIAAQPAAFSVIIEGICGDSYFGDIAIDDVTLTQARCSEVIFA